MCGICGTTDGRGGAALRAMNDRMTHRGPDDAGVFIEPAGGGGLGATRLSVIDVAGGHQPLANEDGSIWAVLNGEIYNFGDLRERLLARGHSLSTRTDTEVLVHLYEEQGDELVHDLEGMYAFAIWDTRKRRLLVARDRFGEKPLFYSHVGGAFTFASELTALLAGSGGARQPDAAAVDEYFVYGYVPGRKSIAAGAFQLQPGHRLVHDLRSGSTQIETYWRPPDPGGNRKVDGDDDLIEIAARLVGEAVSSRLIADVPLGVFLSGGLDSTLVAAFAAQHIGERLKTFTVDYDVGDVGERTGARRVAEAVGADHHELIVSSADIGLRVPGILAGLDQPIADPALIPLRLLAEFARREVTVAVGGEGADELFGGYPRYRWLARTARFPKGAASRVPAFATGRLGQIPRLQRLGRLSDALGPGTTFDRHVGWVTSKRAELRGDLYGPRLVETLGQHDGVLEPVGMELGRGDVVASLMRLDQMHWLPDDVLAKADRASMGASLELRTPFLSKDLAAFSASVPSAIHVRDGGKYLLRKVLDRTLPSLGPAPAKVAFRTPVDQWLRGPLAPLLARQLEESAMYREGWFNRATVAGWMERHTLRQGDLSQALWPVLVLGCWFAGTE